MRQRWWVSLLPLLAPLLVVCTALAAVSPALAESDPSWMARRVLELTNQERARAGLSPCRWNDTLAAAATEYARDLAARDYFAHTSLEGSLPWDRATQHGYAAYGWGSPFVGENLAKGYADPEAAMQGWMNSEGHRANILKPEYRELGVGVAADAAGRLVWVQNFGSRPGVLPVFINLDAPSTESPHVTLTTTSEDVSNWGSVGPIEQMMVSNSPDFAGASWEPYSRNREWTLNNEPGLRKVYVRLKDSRGNVVESSDDIVLVKGAPTRLQAAQRPPEPPGERPRPQFKLGFKALADQIPHIVGEPLEDERHSPTNGDSLQRTTKGLMVWRKADNWTAFTDGHRTWISGPLGLQERSNDARFGWESPTSG